MFRQERWVAAFALVACTYNEYYTSGQGGSAGAGSVANTAGSGGRASAGTGGAGGASAGTGGSAAGGSAQTLAGAAGQLNLPPAEPCTGCVRLSMPASTSSDLELDLGDERDLEDTVVAWRIRVRDFASDVYITTYAENEDPAIFVSSFATLTAQHGWQEIGIDLSQFDDFRVPELVDAGGFAGGSFDPGNPFDKTRVRRVGLIFQPQSTSGFLTPAQVDIDAVTFSDRAGLNQDFSESAGDLEFVGSSAATLDHVPE